MEKAKIQDIVLKHFRANVHLPEGSELDYSRNMLDMGVQSLDAVEITYGTMRELKVELPVTEIAKLRSINELVDLLYGKVADSGT